MTEERYLPPTNGGRWAISRDIEGCSVALIENTSLFNPTNALTVFSALEIPPTGEHLDLYFPIRGKKGRCPTLDVLELFSEIGTKSGSQIGV